MPDLFLRDTDPTELRKAIVDDVLDAIRPLLESTIRPPQRIASRQEMASMLGWSVAKLDRRTKERAIPSLMDGDRRTYIIDEVIAALKAGTEGAELAATGRQTAKRAAKQSG